MPVLVQIDGRDPVTGTVVSASAASHDDERICGLDGRTWWPVIAQLPTLRYDLFDGGFEGRIATPSSSLSLSVEPWPDLPRWTLADGRVRIWTGAAGEPWASWTSRFDGRVTAQPRIANGRAAIAFAADDRWLDAPLLGAYAGTGGAEGGPELKGQVKPLALGAPRFVGGRLIDPVNSVVQMSSAGPIEGVEAAFERLARFGASLGDFASHAALVAAAIPPGGWATAHAAGMVRHGAPPEGRLSYHVRGDRVNGWVRLPGAIIRRIALLSGGAGRIDEASLNALDAARPWPVSVYVSEQTSARELIQRIAASVNATAGVDWLGRLFVAPVGVGAPTLTLNADGTTLPMVASVEAVEIDPPYWRIAVGAARTWEVHGSGEVAFTAELIERGRYDPAETYREGHIVDLASGSRWLYHATTPTSGNAPPTGVTGNVWWDQLSPATAFGDIDAAAAAKLAAIEANADVTVILDLPPIKVFDADYQGVLPAGALPATTSPKVLRAGFSIKTAANVGYQLSNVGCAGTLVTSGASKGDFTTDDIRSAEATQELIVFVDGVERVRRKMAVQKRTATPPAGTPGGTGGGTSTGQKIATTSNFDPVGSTTFVPLSEIRRVTLAAGERLVGTAPLSFTIDGNTAALRQATCKWRYIAGGGVPNSDFGAGVQSSTSAASGYFHTSTRQPNQQISVDDETYYVEPEAGYGAFNQAVSGLAAGDYDVQLVAHLNLSGRTATFTGTATIEAKA